MIRNLNEGNAYRDFLNDTDPEKLEKIKEAQKWWSSLSINEMKALRDEYQKEFNLPSYLNNLTDNDILKIWMREFSPFNPNAIYQVIHISDNEGEEDIAVFEGTKEECEDYYNKYEQDNRGPYVARVVIKDPKRYQMYEAKNNRNEIESKRFPRRKYRTTPKRGYNPKDDWKMKAANDDTFEDSETTDRHQVNHSLPVYQMDSMHRESIKAKDVEKESVELESITPQKFTADLKYVQQQIYYGESAFDEDNMKDAADYLEEAANWLKGIAEEIRK